MPMQPSTIATGAGKSSRTPTAAQISEAIARRLILCCPLAPYDNCDISRADNGGPTGGANEGRGGGRGIVPSNSSLLSTILLPSSLRFSRRAGAHVYEPHPPACSQHCR